MDNVKKIHFTGIKGVGMTPLAIIAKEAGIEVTGADVADVYITDILLGKAGITPLIGFSPDHIKDIDLLITTGAHGGFDNVEVKKAKEQKIPVITQAEAVGLFMSGSIFGQEEINGISVAGCHGKTTTTAMIATLLKFAKKDPSFLIGTGEIPFLGSSGHHGKGNYFIAEADEYATEPTYDKTPKFLWQHPDTLVVTNIDYDHPDLYPTFESLVAAYQQFMFQVLDSGGNIIACGDDAEIQKITEIKKRKIITYGFNSNNNYVLSDIEQIVGGMTFHISSEGKDIGEFSLSVLGEHNALNATAAVIVGLEKGLTIEEIKAGLTKFTGTKRRLEYIGQTISGAHVYDDYAHHPTEIQKTLSALRKRYEKSNIICVFQPHTYSRTKILFDQFKDSFSDASSVILTDIYASQREGVDSSVSSKMLKDAIGSQALYFPTLNEVTDYLEKKAYGSDTILVTMGAGDVYTVAYELVEG